MEKTKKGTFLLSQSSKETLKLEKLNALTRKYNEAIANSNLFFPNQETLQVMLWAKREKLTFGPYQDLTFFEISNRIYSDLVLLEAAQVLFKEHKIKSIQLNMSNHSGNDLSVIDKDNKALVGEAFNTAHSFFQVKMRSELKKFSDGKSGYIAFNETALNDRNKKFLNKKKKEFPNIEFVICKI